MSSIGEQMRKLLGGKRRGLSGRVSVSVAVKGDPEVAAALDGVKVGVQNRVLKPALRKAARLGQAKAKAFLKPKRRPAGRKRKGQRFSPDRSGTLKRAIGVVYRGYRKGQTFAFVIGPRKGMGRVAKDGRYLDPAKYAHLKEGGRKKVKARRGKILASRATGKVFGKKVAAVLPAPFMKPAADYIAIVAPAILHRDVPAGIAREAAKYAAKGKSINK